MGGFGDFLGKVGDALEAGSDLIGVDHIGHGIDNALEATGELADDAGLDNIYDPIAHKVVAPALHYANVVREYGISRPLATTQLLKSANPEHHGGLEALGILSPDSWRDAWNASAGVSPGQAAIANVAGGTGQVNQATFGSTLLPGNLNTLADPNYDITDAAQRERVFGRGLGMLASGTIDAVASWNLDPLVLAGGGIAKVRSAAIVKPIATELSGKTGEELASHYDDLISSSRIDKVVARIAGMSKTERSYVLARDFRNNPAMAQILPEAPNEEAIRAILRTAIDGTTIEQSRLQETYLRGSIELDTIRDVRIKSIETELAGLNRRLAENETSPFYANSYRAKIDAAKARLATEQANAVALEQKLDLTRLLATDVRGSLTQLPRVTLAQRAGDALRNSGVPRVSLAGEHPVNAGIARWYTWQPSRYSPVVRIVRSATSTRIGTVSHDVSGAATTAARAMVDRAGHGLGRGMPLATRSRLIAAVNEAEVAKDPTRVAAALKDAENEVLRHNGGLLGIDAEKVDAFVEDTHRRTEQLLTRTIAGTGDEVYSGVKVNGRRLDLMDDGTLVQIFNSQARNSTPLTDIDEFTKLLRRHARDLDAVDGQTLRAALAGEGGALSQLDARGEQIMESFNRFWKPAQLLRLGWPIRVLTDEGFRVVSVVGAMAHLGIAGESVRNSLTEGNIGARVRDLGLGARRGRKRAEEALAEVGPYRADIAPRATIVDKLADLMQRETRVDAEVAAAKANLTRVEANNRGQRLYRADTPKAKNRVTPRGVHYTTTAPEAGEGMAVHERVANVPAGRTYTPRSGYADPGIAALSDFTTVPEFEALANMPNAALRAKMTTEFPKLPIARYKTKDELLAVYGAELARRRDYAAISHGEGSSFLALHEDAVRALDPSHTQAAARLTDALGRQRTLAEARATLTGDRDRLTNWHDEMNQAFERLQLQATPLAKRERGMAGRAAKFGGTLTITIGGQKYTYDDAFGGELGPIFLDQSSADSTMRNLSGVQQRYVNGMRVKVGQPVVIAPVPPADASTKLAKLHRMSYDRSWERAVNDQIGKDALGKLLLDGRSDEEIAAWMRNHPVGQEYRRRNSVLGSDPVKWAQTARQQVESYLPTPELKALARQGFAKAEDLRGTYRAAGELDEAALPIIHGDSLDLDGGKGFGLWAKTVDTLYAKIGTAPTDVLSRHPYFAAIYRGEMERQFHALAAGADDEPIAEHVIDGMQHRARHKALAEVKRTLYDTANQSNLAHTVRFVMPFYAAWQDALQTWTRLWMEDPSRLARLVQTWNAPAKAGDVYESNGQKFVALPKALSGPLGISPGMPKDYFKQLIFQGQYWYMPGVGAPITVPAAEILRNRPDTEGLLKPLLPYGAGDNMLDQILPTGWQRLQTLGRKEDDQAYLKSFSLNAKVLYTDRRLGKNTYTDDELFAEARRRTNDLATLRAVYAFGLPFGPNIRHPYQAKQDIYNKMQEQYRADPNAFGGLSPDEAFIDQEGDEYFAFTTAATKSNVGGIAPTVAGYEQFNKYKDLIAQMPELGSLIAGDTNGQYSTAVAQWMLDHRIGGGSFAHIRDIRSPQEAIKDAEVNRGWDEWRKIDTAITAALASRPTKSLSAKANLDLKVTRDYLVGKLQNKYPLWATEYGNTNRAAVDMRVANMEKIVDDPRMKDRPGFASLAQYLALRSNIVDALAARDAAGGSKNLTANANTDLRVAFEYLTGKLKLRDTYFADIYSRWLSSDDLDTGGVVPGTQPADIATPDKSDPFNEASLPTPTPSGGNP
jgi:hypothetical protein